MSPRKRGPSTTTSAATFNWHELAQYKQEKRFLDHYPDDFRTFWSPRDNVHGLLVALLSSAQRSLVLNMFGYDDDELDAIVRSKLQEQHVYVQVSLDKRQAAGKHEHAVGHAISHLKIVIVDGVYIVRGSTNWSLSGEGEQDNELTLSRNDVIAAETRSVLDLNHDWMLKQMAAAAQGKKAPTQPSAGPAPRRPARRRPARVLAR